MTSAPWKDDQLATILRGIAPPILAASTILSTKALLPVGIPYLKGLGQSFGYAFELGRYAAKVGITHVPLATLANPAALIPAVTIIGGALTALATVFAIAPLLRSEVYGNARWATPRDLRRQALRAPAGMALGEAHGKILRPEKRRHIGVLAPTRSGKTAGVAVPSMLDFPGTIIAVSSKNDLRRITEPHRSKLGPTYTIQWADPRTPNAWNFFGRQMLSDDDAALERYTAQIAAQFWPELTGEGEYFQSNARRLAQVLFHFHALEARAFGGNVDVPGMVSDLLSFDVEPEEDTGRNKKKKNDKDKKEEDPFGTHLLRIAAMSDIRGYPSRISENLSQWAHMHPKERSQHLTTILTGLNFLTFIAVKEATSRCDFTFADLRDRPTTVYIEFPQSDKGAFGMLTAQFYNALINWGLDNPAGVSGQPILLIFDEFRSLPKMTAFPDLHTSGAGQGLIAMVIVQHPAILREKYGPEVAKEIISNWDYTVAFAFNESEAQEEMAKIVGQFTAHKKTSSGALFKPMQQTLTEAEEGRQLLRPEQWGAIPFGYHVILTKGHKTRPIYAKTCLYRGHHRYGSMVPHLADIE